MTVILYYTETARKKPVQQPILFGHENHQILLIQFDLLRYYDYLLILIRQLLRCVCGRKKLCKIITGPCVPITPGMKTKTIFIYVL